MLTEKPQKGVWGALCVHACCATHRGPQREAPHGIFGYRGVKSGLLFWLIFECWIWFKLTLDKYTPIAMRVTLKWAEVGPPMKERAFQFMSGLTRPLSLVLGVSTVQCCPAWSGMVAMLPSVGWPGAQLVRKKHYFYIRAGEEFAREGQSLPDSESLKVVSKSGLSLFFVLFSFFSPQTCSSSARSLCLPCSKQKVVLYCFLTMQLILFLKNFYNFFWHLKNGMMTTCAGVQTLVGFCGLCNNPEISPPLKLIALNLRERYPLSELFWCQMRAV